MVEKDYLAVPILKVDSMAPLERSNSSSMIMGGRVPPAWELTYPVTKAFLQMIFLSPRWDMFWVDPRTPRMQSSPPGLLYF